MYEVSREHSFSAAHRLRGYSGKCESLHGHNWKVRIHVRAETLDALGMVVDFKKLRAELDRVLGALDHTLLNEIPPFDRVNPTAEAIARHVGEAMDHAITDDRVAVHRCEVWESDGAAATYVLPGR